MSNKTGCVQCSECIDTTDEYCRFCGIRQFEDRKRKSFKFNPAQIIEESALLSPEYLKMIREEINKYEANRKVIVNE